MKSGEPEEKTAESDGMQSAGPALDLPRFRPRAEGRLYREPISNVGWECER